MSVEKRFLVTGGAGFIGSAVVRLLVEDTPHRVCVVDSLTYAGNPASLEGVSASERFRFEKADICDSAAMQRIFAEFRPTNVMHLAAESHVDRSIDGPAAFLRTNVTGTFTLLEAARHFFTELPEEEKELFRFHHISTDEVYGDLGESGGLFTETTPYAPSSPYSASKAASDHLVRAWQRTYGVPVLVTNCSNNFGPRQFPEKLIPLIILRALAGQELPVYGKGEQIRDWLFVEDHARALLLVSEKGLPGETYNIGGGNERKNIEVVRTVCAILDKLAPRKEGGSYAGQIVFVKDRPGHDQRYAIDASKIASQLNWHPQESFESAMVKTVQWYLKEKENWCAAILNGSYRMERLGKGENQR